MVREFVSTLIFDKRWTVKREKVYFLTCYPKTKKDNLTADEKESIKLVVKRINDNEAEG